MWDLYQQAAIMGKRIYFDEEVFGTSLQDSNNGQLSQETCTFLCYIYDGGPVLFYEGEKDNEEENQDLQDEEEVIQQE